MWHIEKNKCLLFLFHFCAFAKVRTESWVLRRSKPSLTSGPQNCVFQVQQHGSSWSQEFRIIEHMWVQGQPSPVHLPPLRNWIMECTSLKENDFCPAYISYTRKTIYRYTSKCRYCFILHSYTHKVHNFEVESWKPLSPEFLGASD